MIANERNLGYFKILLLQTKYTLYEGGVRGVAALWSSRLEKAARVFKKLIHITDWLPTLYSAAGGDLKDLGEIDGIDQWRVLSEGQGHGREKLLLNIDEVMKTEGAIYSRFKLLRGNKMSKRHVKRMFQERDKIFKVP